MNWLDECKKDAEALTQSQRQAVLDTIKSGKTIGETRDLHSVSLAAVCGVIDINLVSCSFLSQVSK